MEQPQLSLDSPVADVLAAVETDLNLRPGALDVYVHRCEREMILYAAQMKQLTRSEMVELLGFPLGLAITCSAILHEIARLSACTSLGLRKLATVSTPSLRDELRRPRGGEGSMLRSPDLTPIGHSVSFMQSMASDPTYAASAPPSSSFSPPHGAVHHGVMHVPPHGEVMHGRAPVIDVHATLPNHPPVTAPSAPPSSSTNLERPDRIHSDKEDCDEKSEPNDLPGHNSQDQMARGTAGDVTSDAAVPPGYEIQGGGEEENDTRGSRGRRRGGEKPLRVSKSKSGDASPLQAPVQRADTEEYEAAFSHSRSASLFANEEGIYWDLSPKIEAVDPAELRESMPDSLDLDVDAENPSAPSWRQRRAPRTREAASSYDGEEGRAWKRRRSSTPEEQDKRPPTQGEAGDAIRRRSSAPGMANADEEPKSDRVENGLHSRDDARAGEAAQGTTDSLAGSKQEQGDESEGMAQPPCNADESDSSTGSAVEVTPKGEHEIHIDRGAQTEEELLRELGVSINAEDDIHSEEDIDIENVGVGAVEEDEKAGGVAHGREESNGAADARHIDSDHEVLRGDNSEHDNSEHDDSEHDDSEHDDHSDSNRESDHDCGEPEHEEEDHLDKLSPEEADELVLRMLQDSDDDDHDDDQDKLHRIEGDHGDDSSHALGDCTTHTTSDPDSDVQGDGIDGSWKNPHFARVSGNSDAADSTSASEWSDVEGVNDEQLRRKIYLVKRSWKHLMRSGATVTRIFYSRLFELSPELESIFSPDNTIREMKLVRMLDMIFGHLGRLGQITEELEEMAVRHISYEVEPGDFEVMREALVYTLGQVLQDRFTSEVRGIIAQVESAWRSVYDLISATAMEAARPYYEKMQEQE